jgi:hypothetical protein
MGNGITYRKADSKHLKASFGPMEAHKEIVRECLVMARRAGLIREHWVADGRAPTPAVPYFDEGADAVADYLGRQITSASVDLDPQEFQAVYIEISCEAADLVDRFVRVAHPFGVPVYSGAGQGGLKGKREMGERAVSRDKPTVVLGVSDRDKSGDDIYTAPAEDSVAWAGRGYVCDAQNTATPELCRFLRDELTGALPRIVFMRLALTIEQAVDLDLLDADGKAEADSVPVPIMDRWLTEAIEGLTDPACREQEQEQEQEQERERERLPAAIQAAIR